MFEIMGVLPANLSDQLTPVWIGVGTIVVGLVVMFRLFKLLFDGQNENFQTILLNVTFVAVIGAVIIAVVEKTIL